MQYCINLLWIHRGDLKQKYIYSSSAIDLQNCIFKPALLWAKANPSAQIFIWFDNSKHNSTCIHASQLALAHFNIENNCPNIQLRDIQDIAIVRNNPIHFSNQVGLYARIDFLKIIICHHCMQYEAYDHCIYTDLTAVSCYLDHEALFCQEALDALASHGILINYKNINQQNQYQHISSDIKNRICAHSGENQFVQFAKNSIILKVLADCINAGIIHINQQLIHRSPEGMPEFYINFFQLFSGGNKHFTIRGLYQGYKDGTCLLNTDAPIFKNHPHIHPQGWISYDSQTHGFSPLGDIYDCNQLILQTSDAPYNYKGSLSSTTDLLSVPPTNNLARVDICYRDGKCHTDITINKAITELKPKLLSAADQMIYDTQQDSMLDSILSKKKNENINDNKEEHNNYFGLTIFADKTATYQPADSKNPNHHFC